MMTSKQVSSGRHTCDVAGARIACDFEPAASGTTEQLLVFVNGFQRPRTDFRALRRRLKALLPRTATLSLDNRGSGETEAPLENLTMDVMAQDLDQVAQHFASMLGLSGWSTLGVSMGGMIALTAATRFTPPDKLGLVSTTAGGALRTWPLGTTPEEKKSFVPFPRAEAPLRERMSRYFAPSFCESSPLLIETMVQNMLSGFQKNPLSADWAQAQYHATARHDAVEDLWKLAGVPTLVVSGDQDFIMPLKNAEELHESIPNSQLVVYEGVGHLILVEAPEVFAKDLSHFFKERSLP